MRVPFLLVTACGTVIMSLLSGCGDAPTAPGIPFQISLSPLVVPAGVSSEGTVMVTDKSRNSVTVRLSTSDGVASVPSSITIPAGSSRATFRVETRVVAADTLARIKASVGDATQEVALQVIAPVARPPTLATLILDTSVVRGGQGALGTVALTGAAIAGGVSVNVRSSNSAGIVPGAVVIPAGALSGSFAIATRPVEMDTQFEITASYGDQTRSVPFRVSP